MDSPQQTARKIPPVQLTLMALIAVLQAGCSVFGIRSAEEAAYSVLQQQGDYELREYESLVVASTLVDSDFDDAGKKAFRRLFNYISGDNQSALKIDMTAPVLAAENRPADKEKIAMTAPVIRERVDQGWRFSFVLPASYTLATAPLPLDERVNLAQIPSRKVASMQYSGSWNQARFNENTDSLLQWIAEQQLEPDSPPRVAGYDPPWTLPFLRRNEVLVDIKP